MEFEQVGKLRFASFLVLVGVIGLSFPLQGFAGTKGYFAKNAISSQRKSVTEKAPTATINDMETGFFESLELTPDPLQQSDSLPRPDLKKKPAPAREQQSGSTPKMVPMLKGVVGRSTPVAAGEPELFSAPTLTTGDSEMPTLWHYFLLTVFSLVGVFIIILLARMYRNISRIDSPDNIVLQIQGLAKEFTTQHRYIKDLKSRIQKTENTFIKVLSHHIDDKYSSLSKDVDMQFQDFYGANKTMLNQYHEINARLSQVEGLLVSLKEFVAEQKQDIKRLNEGSDWIHASSYLLGLIGVVDRIDVELEDVDQEDERDRLTELRESILILLEAHSVCETAPEVGSKLASDTVSIYRIIHIHADKPDQKGRVARVLRPSFVYHKDEQPHRVIREAEIEVYS